MTKIGFRPDGPKAAQDKRISDRTSECRRWKPVGWHKNEILRKVRWNGDQIRGRMTKLRRRACPCQRHVPFGRKWSRSGDQKTSGRSEEFGAARSDQSESTNQESSVRERDFVEKTSSSTGRISGKLNPHTAMPTEVVLLNCGTHKSRR